MIFARSSIGRAAQETNALSAWVEASIISSSVCSVNVFRISPVAGFTLRYGTVSSSTVRVTANTHTASCGVRRHVPPGRQGTRLGDEQCDGSNPLEFDRLHIPCK
jgi:hypothetical protein